MTEVHNFLLRWARLKRASDAWHKADAWGKNHFESAEIVAAGAGAAATLPRIDAAVEPFDMARLHRLTRSPPTRKSAGSCKAACPPS
jgi:hypothetical protein